MPYTHTVGVVERKPSSTRAVVISSVDPSDTLQQGDPVSQGIRSVVLQNSPSWFLYAAPAHVKPRSAGTARLTMLKGRLPLDQSALLCVNEIKL
jgi:hypothetical protein